MTFRDILFESKDVIISKTQVLSDENDITRVFIQSPNGDYIGDQKGYESVRPPKEGIMAVCKGGLWGFIDLQGTTIADFQYKEVEDFSCGYAKVKTTDQETSVYPNAINITDGSIDLNGNWILTDEDGKKSYLPKSIGIAGKILSSNLILVQETDGFRLYDISFKILDLGYIKRVYKTNHKWAYIVETVDNNRLILFSHYNISIPIVGDVVCYDNCVQAKVYKKSNFRSYSYVFCYKSGKYHKSDVDSLLPGSSLRLIEQEHRYGCCDEDGEIILDPCFCDINLIDSNTFEAKVFRDDIPLKISRDGSVLITNNGISGKLPKGLVPCGNFIDGVMTVCVLSHDNLPTPYRSSRYPKFLYGCINEDLQLSVSCQYSHIEVLNKNCIIAEKGPLWGIINSEEREMVPFIYSEISSDKQSTLYLKYELGLNKRCDSIEMDLTFRISTTIGDKKVTLPSKYSCIIPFNDGICMVLKNGNWGVIDNEMSELLPCIFKELDRVSTTRFFVGTLVKKQDWTGIKEEKYIADSSSCTFINIPHWIQVDCHIEAFNSFKVYHVKYDKEQCRTRYCKGVLSKNGDVIIPCEYDEIKCIGSAYLVTENKQDGIIDVSGKVLIPCEYDKIELSTGKEDRDVVIESGYYIIGNRYYTSFDSYKYHYGIANPQGEVIIPVEYDKVIQVDENRIITEWPINVYDKNGTLIFAKDLYIDDLEIMECGRYKIAVDTNTDPKSFLSNIQYGIYTKNGEEIIPCQYTYIYPFEGGYARFCKGGEVRKERCDYKTYRKSVIGGTMGVMDTTGNIVVPADYDYIRSFVGNYAIVTKNTTNNELRWGAIDINGKNILEPEYSYVRVGNERFLFYAVGGTWKHTIQSARDLYEMRFENKLLGAKWGIYDIKANKILIDDLDSIGRVCDNKVSYKLNNLFGYIRLDSEICIRAEYAGIGEFSCGLCPVAKTQEDGSIKYGYIDSSNRIVIPYEYDSALTFHENQAHVEIGNMSYVIDTNGNILSSYEKRESYYHEDDGWTGYTSDELEEMYREAMGGNPENEWNIY